MACNKKEQETDLEEHARFLTTCSICMDQFVSPKVLPCQHTFCLECLKSFFESVNRTRLVPVSNFPCPTCRKICYVPQGGVRYLSDDFRIAQILDLLTAIESSQQKTKIRSLKFGHCSICRFQKREQAANAFCLQCEKAFCSECLSHHSLAKIFHDHTIIKDEEEPKKELKDEDKTESAKEVDETLCAKHKNELKYVCEDCSVVLCTVCLLGEHSSHLVKKVSQVLSGLEDRVEGIKKELMSKLQKSESILHALNSFKENQLTNCLSCEDDIRKASREAIQEIEKLQSQLLSSIKQSQQEFARETATACKCIEDDSGILNEHLASLKTFKSGKVSRTFLSDVSNIEKFVKDHKHKEFKAFSQELYAFKPSINIILGNLEKSKKTIDLQKFCNKRDLNENPKSTKNSSSSLISSSSSSSLPTSSSSSSSSLKQPPINTSSKPSRPSQAMAKEKRATKDLFSFPAAVPPPRKVTRLQMHNDAQADKLFGVPSRDQLIQGLGRRLSCRLSTKLELCPVKKLNWTATGFKLCRDCCFLQVKGDWLLAACDSKAVNADKRIRLFDLSGVQRGALTLRQVLEPWSMLYVQASNSLVLTDQSSRSIRQLRLDDSGKCSKVSTISPNFEDRPTGIALTSSGQYVVSDTGTRPHRLTLYEATSNLLEKRSEFALRGHGDGEVDECSFVAVDHQDRIIVSDAGSKQVKVLSLTGEQLLKFSCSCSFDGSKEMQPQGVAVDDCNNIFVVDQAIKGVGLFSSEGGLIAHVASTKGRPWGLSYLQHANLLAVATSVGLEVFEL